MTSPETGIEDSGRSRFDGSANDVAGLAGPVSGHSRTRVPPRGIAWWGMQTLGGRPEIHYPCSWTYRIICTREDAVRAAVTEIVGPIEHQFRNLGASSAGRYQRLELVLEVRDEAHRNEIFAALARLPDVRFVL